MRAEILIFPGFDELDAIGPLEVLRQAQTQGAPFETRLVSMAGPEEIVASHGLRVFSEASLAANGQPDLVIVPGGGWTARSKHGAWAEAQRREIPDALARLHRAGVKLGSVCTGSMLLATAGILRGRRATTHHAALDELRALGVELVDARVVDDGDIITAGGVTSGLDLALWLVERFAGAKLSREVAAALEHTFRGPVASGHKQVAAG